MCCCPVPNVNGTPGYRWQLSDSLSVRRPDPPTSEPGEVIIFDLPGRCGGQDSHAYHYRVVGSTWPALLVRHGGGQERHRLANARAVLNALAQLDDHGRYWLLNALFHAACDARMVGRVREMDPVAHRCGVNDYADSMCDSWEEIEGDYYETQEVDAIREQLETEIAEAQGDDEIAEDGR